MKATESKIGWQRTISAESAALGDRPSFALNMKIEDVSKNYRHY
jgi:hypothetical protein